MSPQKSKNKPEKAKPTPDVYVGLLLAATAALAIGCWLLVMELNKYNWQGPPGM